MWLLRFDRHRCGHRRHVNDVGAAEVLVLLIGLPLVVWAGVTVLRRR